MVSPLKKVIRRADEKDIKTVELNRQKEISAFSVCEQKIAAHDLKMKLVRVEYSFDCSKITFLDNEFDYDTIPFPKSKYLTTIKESSKVRYLYYVCETEYHGTIYAKLADGTISDVKFIEAKGVNEAVEYMCSSSTTNTVVFWVIWIILIGAAVYGFCYLNNRWLED